jgi:hypothetical protein
MANGTFSTRIQGHPDTEPAVVPWESADANSGSLPCK